MASKREMQVKVLRDSLKGKIYGEWPNDRERSIRGHAAKQVAHLSKGWAKPVESGPLIKLHYPPV